MKELSRLLGYIYENPYIGNNGFHALSAKELSFALKNMNQFERPDLFAVTDNRIIILEHFEFDASKRSRKGLIGKREEHQLEKRRISAKTNSILSLDKATYSISLYSWANNFTHYFDRHYSKIPDYIDAVRSQVNDAIHRNIIVGFFIENQFPPYVLIDGKLSMLNFINTKQFRDKILSSNHLDFVLFGCYYNGKKQLFYIDKDSLHCTPYKLIDLYCHSTILSHINNNECEIYI